MKSNTVALAVRIPCSLKFDDKKAPKIDLKLARKQQEDLNDTLREAGVNIIEVEIEDDSPHYRLFNDDAAVIINGTALLARIPKRENLFSGSKYGSLLNDLAWQVVESPSQINGKTVHLEGSDVLFTGKEIFVGIRKNGTNTEGAAVVAKTFADFSVVPIHLNSNHPLKYFVAMASEEVMVFSRSNESQLILRKIERESTFRYKVLTVEKDEAVCCINVNNHLVFRHDLDEIKFRLLQSPIELWGLTVSELVKIGTPFSRFCLLVPGFSKKKN